MRHILLISIAAAIFAIGCSGSGSDHKEDGGVILSTQKIDASGGVLETDDISVTIPEGAFSEMTEISLSKNSDVSPVAGQISENYILSGVPENFSRDIQVKMKWTEAVEEDLYMIVGQDTFSEDGSSSFMLYDMYEAEVADGFLTATIYAMEQTTRVSRKTVTGNTTDLHFVVVDKQVVYIDGNRYFIFHSDYLLFAKSLSQAFDDAVNDIQSYGFEEKLAGDTKNAVINHIVFGPDIKGITEETHRPIEPLLLVNSDEQELLYSVDFPDYIFDDSHRLATHTGFFRLVEKLYNADTRVNAFFNAAAEGWLRKAFSAVQPYVPPGYTSAPLTVLQGIRPDLSTLDHAAYGDAVSPFFDFMDDRYDMKKNLVVIYNNVFSGDDFIDAVSHAVGADEKVWWPEFLKAFVSGQVTDLAASTIVAGGNISGSFSADSDNLKKTFTEDETAPFETRLYKVTVDDTLEKDLDYLRFTMSNVDVDDSYLKVIVFGMKNGALNFIGCDTDIGVGDIDAYTEENTLYVFAVNCAAILPDLQVPIRDVSLTVEAVKKDAQAVEQTSRLSFKASVYGTILYTKTNFEDEMKYYDVSSYVEPWLVDGTLKGKTFTGQQTVSDNGVTQIVDVTVAFDDNFEHITSFTFSGSYSDASSTSFTETISVAGGKIPYVSTSSGWRIFKLEADAVCGEISSFSYQSESSKNVSGFESKTTRTLQDYTCSDDSKIIIQIKEQ